MRGPSSYDHCAFPNAVSAALWAARNGLSRTPHPAGKTYTAGQGRDTHSTVPCLLESLGWTKELFCSWHGLLCWSICINPKAISWTFHIRWVQCCDVYQGTMGPFGEDLWIRGRYVWWCVCLSGFRVRSMFGSWSSGHPSVCTLVSTREQSQSTWSRLLLDETKLGGRLGECSWSTPSTNGLSSARGTRSVQSGRNPLECGCCCYQDLSSFLLCVSAIIPCCLNNVLKKQWIFEYEIYSLFFSIVWICPCDIAVAPWLHGHSFHVMTWSSPFDIETSSRQMWSFRLTSSTALTTGHCGHWPLPRTRVRRSNAVTFFFQEITQSAHNHS